MGLFNILWWNKKNIKALLLRVTIVTKTSLVWSFDMWTALAILIQGPPFLPERMMDRKTVGIQSCIFGRYCLENKWSLWFQEKQLIVFMANHKIQACKQHCFDSSPRFKDFSDEINDDVNICDFLIFYN